MSWYQAFNLIEAGLWFVVAMVIAIRAPRATRQQFRGVILATVSFSLFGVTDILEAFHEGFIPLWLWGMKCLCGVGILSSRYTWRGWNTFRWRDREFLFGLFCLAAVVILIVLQHRQGWAQSDLSAERSHSPWEFLPTVNGLSVSKFSASQ